MGKLRDAVVRFFSPNAHATFAYTPVVDAMRYGFGGQFNGLHVGREEALSVSAVQRGRNLICGIGTLPLVAYAPGNVEVRSPFLEQINANVPNVVLMSQTLEDLLFKSVAWWRVSERMSDGFPRYAYRVDVDKVSINPPVNALPSTLPSGMTWEGVVWVDGEPVPWADMIRFDSPNPPLLATASRTIRRLRKLEQAAEMYADNPRPLDYFSVKPNQVSPFADDEEAGSFIKRWISGRRKRSTAIVPEQLDYNTVDAISPNDLQLSKLMEQAMLELANALGIDPEDLGISTTSRTYQNGVDRRQDRINDVYAPYMRAITDRLSMDDVTKHGHKVRFDLDDYLRADPKTRAETAEKWLNLGVKTIEEVRTEEGLPNMPGERRQRPIQATVGQKPMVDSVQADMKELTQFNSGAQYTFDFSGNNTRADNDKRTVTGLIVPFNESASSGGRKYRFLPGSLKYNDLKRVKLLRDHDNSQAIGYATSISETADGYMATFKVANGPRGDEALALASEGVLDGLSIGVDFDDASFSADPINRGVLVVSRANLRETSLTAMPAFDNSRLTSVRASRDGGKMECEHCGRVHAPGQTACTPAPIPAQFSDEQLAQLKALFSQPTPQPEPEPEPVPAGPAVVNPTTTGATFVRESLPYRFDRGGNLQFGPNKVDFSNDIITALKSGDQDMDRTEAGKRVKGFLEATFATVSTDINELNPEIQRPDMYVDQRDYKYVLWNAVNKGAPPNGVQPFRFPKFNTASGLVSDHTEGVEPTPGALTTTSQVVNPTALAGKASITREVWDMGGNPAVSTLIWNQMLRSWKEGLETATATFLNTLTAAADINLGAGVVDDALADAWDQALADLQFVRDYDFSMFALEKNLYKAFVAAEDDAGRPLYPILNPSNANGQSRTRFQALDLSGVTGVPSWALSTGSAGSPNNSWLFDPSTMYGWATAPQRIEAFGTDASGNYAPVAMIDLGIWGYKAFANTDIGGVRQVIYDTTA